MDRKTVKWANSHRERTFPKDGLVVRELSRFGFERPMHNAQFAYAAICRTCGVAIPYSDIEVEDGPMSALEVHHRWHHRRSVLLYTHLNRFRRALASWSNRTAPEKEES